MPVIDGKIGAMFIIISYWQVDNETQDTGSEKVPEIYSQKKQEYFVKSELFFGIMLFIMSVLQNFWKFAKPPCFKGK